VIALLTAARLCTALLATHGAEVPRDRLCRAAIIVAHVADEWPVELVAAIAAHESGFDHWRVNPVLGACGPMQVVWSSDRARQDRRCARVRRDAWTGYRAGVRKLDQSAADCARMGVVGTECVLRVYAAGPGWRGEKAGEAAREFRAMADEIEINPAPVADRSRV
jgi:hypothetical protein